MGAFVRFINQGAAAGLSSMNDHHLYIGKREVWGGEVPFEALPPRHIRIDTAGESKRRMRGQCAGMGQHPLGRQLRVVARTDGTEPDDQCRVWYVVQGSTVRATCAFMPTQSGWRRRCRTTSRHPKSGLSAKCVMSREMSP